MTMSDSLVIVPTYNEAHNIRKLIHKVMSLEPKLYDASPDGTAESVRELQVEYSGRLHLLEREGKLGLGTAYVEGFRFALGREYLYVCEMDADFSHNAVDLPRLI